MFNRNLIFVIAAAGLVTSCSDRAHSGTTWQHFDVVNDNVVVRGNAVPDAIVSADGNLRIADQRIALTPPQQEMFKHYHASVVSLRSHEVATGMAGAAMGGQALASVASGLASGNPDKIGPEIEARAGKIEAEAAKLCIELSEIRTTQEAIAQQVAQFKPYALLDAKSASDCKSK
jgi:hypothetical protein